ncbi:hypothetical protein M8J76_008992 [Diaphorina citri]|nr:hypothetical protein M8J76_008992 [Diaphorina citri]
MEMSAFVTEEEIEGPKSPELIPRPPTTAPIPHIHTSSFLLDKNPPPPPPRIFKEMPHHRQHRHPHQEETMPRLKEPAFGQDSTSPAGVVHERPHVGQVVELLGLVTVAPRVGLGFRGGGKGGGTDPVVEVVT